ncbi:5-methyltetrahydropteroyltriglutamate--homocysteine S-methyltransferase [Candidatus Desulforudis audaxviator MP104C]|uniref:5-methyltetrahydropteroyltriglutamate--homocysteine methyltransferase n=1 Tax=Desulforudis audaxviator (strain MP104C) TaxID=477974 RepID=B1I638_DESAP|nr:5-methyltetrahydropteroyltriglutamate--homocysteine S-methyltransferase [Candidatus Desulforudis audaxviator]ACA60487.1 5-methyltetrahydropteroyltriglutamate--homocysteine S-methyltransferase [Candidatus Desulforudis audaxviator MP104C]
MLVSNIGYPRMGRERTLKKLLEGYWGRVLDEEGLLAGAARLEEAHWRQQVRLGVELVPVGDLSLYDHVLDTAVMFGLVPERFEKAGDGLSLYFAMARGGPNAPACAMRKWFNTNYHYIAPEWERKPVLVKNLPLQAYLRAKDTLNGNAKPVLLGPFTLIKLSKNAPEWRRALYELSPLYAQVLRELDAAGATWVQVDEPSLILDVTEEEAKALAAAYRKITEGLRGLKIMLQTYFGGLSQYARLMALPVDGLGLDFVHGYPENIANLERHGFPPDKWLGLGIVDGRNIWRTNLRQKLDLLHKVFPYVPATRIWLQPSCSLLHLPVSAADESHLPSALRQGIAFADERLTELRALARAVKEGETVVAAELAAADQAQRALAELSGRVVPAVRMRVSALKETDFQRTAPYAERRKLQSRRLALPLFPTTTIGSFPQTPEVRAARARRRRGEVSKEQYDAFIRGQIAEWVRIQEQLGLDVLVHGEFERNDMVEYFATRLQGFAVTSNAWVQSYGSRCVKPPILFGDVYRDTPLTLAEALYAQSLTPQPVKGILTGPVTMLNWSFVREDLESDQIAYQVALAIRDEIVDLEKAGLAIIQVDEPALREGLPLRTEERAPYLSWAVSAFRLATGGACPETQIHTHMCYVEFGDILEAIEAMDADVISIETARRGGFLEVFKRSAYHRDIGLGVYDVHSPRVPEVEDMERVIRQALDVFRPEQLWVNPDCGLKTRQQKEVAAALKRMVKAARRLRTEYRPD